MGNCQAVDAAALAIQYPSGRIERLYAPVGASDVMKMNPGHYVSLIIPLTDENNKDNQQSGDNGNHRTVRFTRVKLLRPNETLTLGHAYRLITTQEVMSVLKAKRKQRRSCSGAEKSEIAASDGDEEQQARGCYQNDNSDVEIRTNNKEMKFVKRHKPRSSSGSMNSVVGSTSKSWRPALQSIAEGGGS